MHSAVGQQPAAQLVEYQYPPALAEQHQHQQLQQQSYFEYATGAASNLFGGTHLCRSHCCACPDPAAATGAR